MLNIYSKDQHSFLGKHHIMKAKWKISLLIKGRNNSMFGKKHTKKN